MKTVLHKEFFNRPTLDVARDLLGKQLCRRVEKGKILRAAICETEAYDGFEDKASHAHRGMTPRNRLMFGPPGYAYIYLCYGVHWLLNVTTREESYPAAVLIRGIEGTLGPGRLTKHLRIDRELNGQLMAHNAGLWIEDHDVQPRSEEIAAIPRIGIDYAGAKWRDMPWRFVWSEKVSRQ